VRWFYSVASILSLGLRRTARNLQEVVKKKGLPWSAVKGWETATRASTC
jgi:acylpyruvate hydrolase